MTKKFHIFYGWYIVIASVLITVYVGGLLAYGFTALINPIAATFGWSYAQISLGLTFRSMLSVILNPFMGKVADRFPPNRLILLGVIISGLGLFFLSRVQNLFAYYQSFIIIALGHTLSVTMVPTTVVARWFKSNIGKANVVLAMGFDVGGLLIPVLVRLIDFYGWRTSLVIFASGLLLLGIPLSFVFRSRPEEYGLTPDGKPHDQPGRNGKKLTADIEIGIREAVKMRHFWLISIAWMLHAAAVIALLVHVMPSLTSIGMDRATAGTIAALLPISSLIWRLPFGWFCDVFNKKYVVMISIALSSTGLVLFTLIDSVNYLLIGAFVICFGLGLSSFMALRPALLREYFGSRNFGTIYGVSFMIAEIGVLASPPLVGWVFDIRQVYNPTWLVLGLICLSGVILMADVPKTGQRTEASPPVGQH